MMSLLLVVKPGHLKVVRNLFGDTTVNITSEGFPYLGGPLGTEDYVENFVCSKVKQWNRIQSSLSEIAKCQPHAAYATLTHGLVSKWLFLCQTTHNIHYLLEPLETTIRTKAFTDRAPPNKCLRNLFALPVRHGSLGISLPTNLFSEFENSLKVCTPLIKLIMKQNNSYSYEVHMYSWNEWLPDSPFALTDMLRLLPMLPQWKLNCPLTCSMQWT